MFEKYGAHILVDGQFGSTGKGAFASYLAHQASHRNMLTNFAGAISSSGPNSGHTSIMNDGSKIVLKQLPTFAVWSALLGHVIPAYLSAGAVIYPPTLREEALRYPHIPIFVHPNAAIVTELDRETEKSGSIRNIASTQSGTGAALARKIYREPRAIAKHSLKDTPNNVMILDNPLRFDRKAYFVEVAQGFSLGINSEFYPHVTSRECTVMQAMADARIPPRLVTKVFMCVRTYPIRVGNLDEHSSGNWYADQAELDWKTIGVEPELTTVTKRIRRVASFSMIQFADALMANEPDTVAINFMNYLTLEQQEQFLDRILKARLYVPKPFTIVLGRGPRPADWSEINA